MEECDHDWKYDRNSMFKIGDFGETIERYVVCKKCGKTGREVWVFSCYVEDE